MADPIAFAKPRITEEDISAVTKVLRSGWITSGSESLAFEQDLCEYLGADNVVVCSSNTAAEEICLAYLDLPAGSRVGVPSWTFASTGIAAHRVGLTPVLLDVDEDNLNLSADSLSQAVDSDGGLSAVVGVHYAGNALSPMIRKVCAEAGIPFIEDAAHAFGTSDDRGLIRGNQETLAACFSFYATKNLATAEGGAIATSDSGLAEFARTFRLHGMSANAIDRYKTPGKHAYDIEHPGLKANMPDLVAALGRSQLRRYSETQGHRRALVGRYRAKLQTGHGLRFVPHSQDHDSADHLMVVDVGSVERRDRAITYLTANSIGSSVHFRPLHTFSWFKANVPIGPGGVGVSEKMNGRVLSLPLHSNLTLDDIDRICDAVNTSLGG